MEVKNLCLLYFIMTTRLASGESLYYKLPKDHDPSQEIRGNSFGLENFLLQAYKDVDSLNINDDTPIKRTRVKETPEKTESINIRGQTFGLENLAPNLYDFNQPPLGLAHYETDFKPITEQRQDSHKRRLPEAHISKNNGNEERRERNKIRKPGKHVVRRPVTTSESPSTTAKIAESQNIDIQKQEHGQNTDQKSIVNELITQVAEASYAVPKTQEIPETEKDTDHSTKQRPRKRVTMRRRKRPLQASTDSEKALPLNEPGSANEIKDVHETVRNNEYAPPQTSETTSTTTTTTTQSTTTMKARTDKERPSRRKPGGFRRVPVDDSEQQNSSKVEPTTSEYRNDLDTNESSISTTFTPEIIEYSEEPFTRSTTTTTVRSTSSEETSAADLKTILKQQSGPLSLSELLQTQNLSLADFLKNRKEAALLLSGRRGTTTPRPDSREHSRLYSPNFNTKSRPFTRHRQESESEESKSKERVKSTETTTLSSERYTYNGFVPKNPRVRYSHFKGAYPTIKSNFGSEEKVNSKSDEREKSDSQSEHSTNQVATTESSSVTRVDFKHIPKRFNDVRLKLRIHRRKYNPSSTTNTISKEGKSETTTTPSTTVTVSSTQATRERLTTTEEVTTKRIGLRIPFKSSNNPELSLILPNKNKSEEKTEKRERFSNYSSRVHSLKKSSNEKDDSKSKESLKTEATTPKVSQDLNETKTPLDDIDMDDEKEIVHEEILKENVEQSKEENDKNSKRVEVVGRIPLPTEHQKYEPKDEILELLKPGSNSDRLQRILESRNMTVKELLENREKSSLQSNFTQLFNQDDLGQPTKNEISTTTSDPNFKIFQSLPDFPPIHRNLFQKNVKEIKSNSYPDSQVDESRLIPKQVKVNATVPEPRGSKQLNGVVEVRKKLLLNSESESRDSLEGNDGLLERWNTRDKVIFFNNVLPKDGEKATPTIRSHIEKYSVTENEVAESDIILLETIRKNQDANRKLKNNINEILQEQSQVRDLTNDMDKSFIPPAVKSAIIASSVVLGLAMFVFVAIFAACGWKQRQIRLRARSSILNDALAKPDSDKKGKSSALSPVNFKQSSVYKKSLEMDDESSSAASISSNASSYLWNTLKNTFAGRNSLKNRLDKEEKIREDRLEGLKSVLRTQENRRSDILVEEDSNEETFSTSLRKQEERYSMRKGDYIKRSPSFTTSNHFSSCTHGH